MNKLRFQTELKSKGIQIDSNQLAQFDIYYQTLVEWNEKMNLTAITEREEVYLKHFLDSISAAFYFDFTKISSVCDVGAGAGFPSIPLKICFPHLNITIVDSLKKRIGFLEHLSNVLGIEKTQFYHDRAEVFGQREEFREHYDVVMARAVARLNVLSELCIPLVKRNGSFLAMKGMNTPEEVSEANNAIKKLGGVVKEVSHFRLPIEESERYIVTITKQATTPKKYPRKAGTPNRNPLL
jgi:16S rRNA (guanine527-N7)-methyltransferase